MSSNTNSSHSNYIHGSDPQEQRRLSLLNDLMNASSLRELRLKKDDRVLDVGSGLGQFSRAMARVAGPGGSVVGVERDLDQLAHANQLAEMESESGLVEFRQGDGFALPLFDEEWQCFDVVHARFLLEHINEPFRIVSQMKAAARPGGRVVLVDDDHDGIRLWPEPWGFALLWQAYVGSYQRLGNDPFVGRKLVSLLHEAGLTQIRNSMVFFGGCAGNEEFELVLANLLGIFEGARDEMLVDDCLDQVSFDRAMAALVDWGKDPSASLWYSMCWAEGFVPV